jgi:hypothetical protein
MNGLYSFESTEKELWLKTYVRMLLIVIRRCQLFYFFLYLLLSRQMEILNYLRSSEQRVILVESLSDSECMH